MKNLLMLIPFTFALIGCEYTTQICTPENRVDIPNFEGTYAIHNYDLEKFTAEQAEIKIQKTGLGVYSETIFTCKFGDGPFIAESKNDKGRWSANLITVTENSVWFNPAVFDTNELSSQGIPYEIIEEETRYSKLIKFFRATTKNLVIDNSQIAPENLAARIHPYLLNFWFEKK